FLMLTGGMMAPVSGTYCFLGEEMPIFEDHRLADRLRLGFVFETGQLFNHLTVSENLSLPLLYHRNLSKPMRTRKCKSCWSSPNSRRGRTARRARWLAIGSAAPASPVRSSCGRKSCCWTIRSRDWICVIARGGSICWSNYRAATNG